MVVVDPAVPFPDPEIPESAEFFEGAGDDSRVGFSELFTDCLRMILRTAELPPSGPVFFGLGRVPSGAIFSSTPYLISPASSKLVLF